MRQVLVAVASSRPLASSIRASASAVRRPKWVTVPARVRGDVRVTDGWFVRYQAAGPNRRGTYRGVFALCNGLARDGALGDDGWRAADYAFERACVDPETLDPGLFDRDRRPVVSWVQGGRRRTCSEASRATWC